MTPAQSARATNGLPYRSDCRCACHQPEATMVHIMACCVPDPQQDTPRVRVSATEVAPDTQTASLDALARLDGDLVVAEGMISDEAVEAALSAWYGPEDWPSAFDDCSHQGALREDMRQTLTAALPHITTGALRMSIADRIARVETAHNEAMATANALLARRDAEIAALKHDLEKYMGVSADLATEIERLKEEGREYDSPAWEANDRLNARCGVAYEAFERIIAEGAGTPFEVIAKEAVDRMVEFGTDGHKPEGITKSPHEISELPGHTSGQGIGP